MLYRCDMLVTGQADEAASALGKSAFIHQHSDDLLSAFIAKQLAKRFLMPSDAIAIDQLHKVARGVACQSRFGEMRIGRDELRRAGAHIGEIAATTA